KEKDLQVTLHSNLPADQNISLTINTKKSQLLALKIRKPNWVETAVVRINGAVSKDSKIDAEGYIVINRKWKDGDVVEVALPSTLHSVSMPDNASRKAFFYGPVLLAGNLGAQEPDPMKGVPVLVTGETEIKQWIKQEGSDPLHFTTLKAGFPTDVKLQPFYSIQNDYYSVYWDVFTPQTWKDQQKIYEENRKAERDLEDRTVDILRVGEMQPERDHNFTGDKTETGESHTRKFRIANEDGSFTFNMKVDQELSHTLIATYWGMDNRGRNFDIIVDGEKIASEDLNKYKESKFYDISYEIPLTLTKGKKTITVIFKGKPHNQAGPVYGVRVVKGVK
ncbi:MAG TPA: DUF6805 domain-containing protein, partial [Cyclobacteriaceae bacterium]|nr:DUF6805 domain-containing protein [Cyclobacteriaceae bacterium]